MYRGNKKTGFTLVEILIVVIILGILAAIVIPQFTNASTEARWASTSSLLQTLRSQIELYKLQHGDDLPALHTNWTPFTGTTTFNGTIYGPYMQQEPKNPMVGLSSVTDGTTGAAVPATGWVYDYTGGTGKIWATNKVNPGDAAPNCMFVEDDPDDTSIVLVP